MADTNGYADYIEINGVTRDLHDARLSSVSKVAVTGKYSDLEGAPSIGDIGGTMSDATFTRSLA